MFANYELTQDLENDPQSAILDAPWRQAGDQNYPPWYFYSLGRYRVESAYVAKLRQALVGLPRVDPRAYDILFNSLLRTWDVVKWVPTPEPAGELPGGFMVRSVLEPYPVYSLNARERDPSTLSDVDFERMRSLCVTIRGGDVIDRELDAVNEAWQSDEERKRQDAEHDIGGYYHGLIRREAEELGVADATPEDMARRFGGLPAEWDPDTYEN